MARSPWHSVAVLAWALALAELATAQLNFPPLEELRRRASLALQEEAAEQAALRAHVVGPHNFCGGGPKLQYSGTLPAGDGDSYFFWLAKAAKPAPPGAAKTPLLLWLSGGPGCSSTLALLFENGPCRVVGRDAFGWQTESRLTRWNEIANVVWVDQPAGVGYSAGGASSRDEVGVADHMDVFLQHFFKQFPDLHEAPFFITGESYAGHYIPAIAAKLVEGKKVNIAGIAMGNALVNPLPQFSSQPEMAYTGGAGGSLGKGVIDKETYETMLSGMPTVTSLVETCQARPNAATCLPTMVDYAYTVMMPIQKTGWNPYDLRMKCDKKLLPTCYNTSLLKAFLNDPEVKEKLGVVTSAAWMECNMDAYFPFITSGDWMARYDQDVVELLGANVKVLVYSGDCDFMVDWIGTKTYLKELAWPHQQHWSTTPDEVYNVAGVQRGMQRSHSGLTFVQLYQAGHLVPYDQPEAALAMMREFIYADATSKWNLPRVVALSSDAATWFWSQPLQAVPSMMVACILFLGTFATLFVIRSSLANKASNRNDGYIILH